MDSLKNVKFEFTENLVRLTADSDGPLRHIWFVFLQEEFSKFAEGQIDHVTDIGHNLISYGAGLCMFYDLKVPRESYGNFEVPYHRVNFPIRLRRMISRLLRNILSSGRNLKENPYAIELSQERLQRIISMYGPGTGNVEVEISENAMEKYQSCLGTDNFDDRIEYLKTCAKNSTMSWMQTHKVKLSNDGSGFMFSIPGMWGGLIRHKNNDGSVEWSIHT